jgi:hypothetical protein
MITNNSTIQMRILGLVTRRFVLIVYTFIPLFKFSMGIVFLDVSNRKCLLLVVDHYNVHRVY